MRGVLCLEVGKVLISFIVKLNNNLISPIKSAQFEGITFRKIFILKDNINSSNSSKKRGLNTTITKFTCKLCPKNVSDNDNAVLYDLYEIWVHIKCSHFNYIDYKYLQGCNHGIASLVSQSSFHLVI